ncbi:MAG TPA: NAD(P)-dependent oxidoreductase, partial [Thermomicrobiales bacterium]|nr:NAD(P)-dependent oxidoreductase [Thermomicrobiales bacterium]
MGGNPAGIALIGTGFIGRAVVRRARVEGGGVQAVAHPHVPRCRRDDPERDAARWIQGNTRAYSDCVKTLRGHDRAINSAGAAAPASSDFEALYAANVVWPAVLSRACADAGVRRLVHVSSAAVQGRRDPLDESADCRPLSPYAQSKADGESALARMAASGLGAPETVLYRPTSVQGAGRGITEALGRLARLPRIPVNGDGSQQLPLALEDNVAAAALFLAQVSSAPPPVALHPWEGLTTADLVAIFAPGARILHLPPGMVMGCLA